MVCNPATGTEFILYSQEAARFTAREESAAQAILSLAASTSDDPALVAWLRANAKLT
jgi:prophage maintenance system killer protein